MDPGADAPEPASQPPPSTALGDPAPPAEHPTPHPPQPQPQPQPQPSSSSSQPSRYESQKRRDWNTFLQYLKNHKPPLTLARCSGAHVIEFLKYLDQFGKTKVHNQGCEYFGQPSPPAPCPCPLKQAWGSLDALIGRLRAAYEENGGKPETNPFGAKAVRIYLREVRESQAKARGVPYEKKKRKRSQQPTATVTEAAGSVTVARAAGEGSSAASSAAAAAEEGQGSGAPPEGGHQSAPAATAPPPPTSAS